MPVGYLISNGQLRKRDKNEYELNVDQTEFMERNCPFLFHHAFFIGKFISLFDSHLRLVDVCLYQKTHKSPQKDRQNLGSKTGIKYANFKPGFNVATQEREV